jgi:hypothetical protein
MLLLWPAHHLDNNKTPHIQYHTSIADVFQLLTVKPNWVVWEP